MQLSMLVEYDPVVKKKLLATSEMNLLKGQDNQLISTICFQGVG